MFLLKYNQSIECLKDVSTRSLVCFLVFNQKYSLMKKKCFNTSETFTQRINLYIFPYVPVQNRNLYVDLNDLFNRFYTNQPTNQLTKSIFLYPHHIWCVFRCLCCLLYTSDAADDTPCVNPLFCSIYPFESFSPNLLCL